MASKGPRFSAATRIDVNHAASFQPCRKPQPAPFTARTPAKDDDPGICCLQRRPVAAEARIVMITASIGHAPVCGGSTTSLSGVRIQSCAASHPAWTWKAWGSETGDDSEIPVRSATSWPPSVLTSRSNFCAELVDGKRPYSLCFDGFRHRQDHSAMRKGDRGPAPPGQSWRVLMNSKMKTLSLAVLGFVGFGAAGAAMAACPTSLVPPWTATNIGGGASAASSVTGGYDTTECRLQSTLGNSGAARAQVRDDTPANETRYRAQFVFDASALSGAGGTNQTDIFLANSAAQFNGLLRLVRMQYGGSGAGTKRLFITAACNNGTTNTCVGQVDLPTQAGPNRIEFDLTVGASGTLRYWVTPLATATSDASPTGTITLTGGNAGWVGVDTAFVGLASPSAAYRAVNTGLNAYFDQFDSRRQTFIGH